MDDKHRFYFARVFELYNKYGIKSVTMDDVARELGISKKTLYVCIKDKNDLVGHIISMIPGFHNERLTGIINRKMNAVEELLSINECMTQMGKELNQTFLYDLKKYYPELYQEMVHSIRSRFFEIVKNNLIKGRDEGLYRKEMNIEIIASLHVNRMEYRFHTDWLEFKDRDLKEVMREIHRYHMHGITTDTGRELFNKLIKNRSK